ncbi:MAG: Carboxylesterase (Est-1) [Parcubacteria group bacterium GW2011_GWE2_39_37]|uniref:Carboxylesterase (Est-1) n=1 Tax=Candidatus Falkowbacteria bacterium GW2011_GWF2_39_8 TaxID=1618642 RepID=A0A0G0S9N7_9BACT|nr:MAG: Carboxylesterase (Est-1) [Parcubacteria group bacterium GW2011_GWE2_39_37]KKR31480.1 MAG: Carboxylesterase (Est-1) [Candidatus Falkowbacteria bacterium GW2011_GWF2_39_8]
MIENYILKKDFVRTALGNIHYFYNDSFAEKATVVFLHGLSANHTTWLETAEILHHNGFNFLALDLRGHGMSDKSSVKEFYQIKTFAEDLGLVLAKENISKFFLVGYSFGGVVALDYVLNQKNLPRGMVLISANHNNPLKYTRLTFLSPVLYVLANIFAFLFLWQKRKKYDYYSPGSARGYWSSVWLGLKTMPISINLWMLSQMHLLNFKDRISAIGIPTMVLCSRKDPFVSTIEIKEIAAALPGAEIVFSNNQSHFIATQAHDEMTEKILHFLKKYENCDI